MRDEPRPRECQGWFADVADLVTLEENPGLHRLWQPCLQLDGVVHSFDVWFESRAACEAYIRDEILGQGMLD